MEPEVQRFHAIVRQWIELDTTIRDLLEALRQRRAAKALLSQQIITYMIQQKVTHLETYSGKIRMTMQERLRFG